VPQRRICLFAASAVLLKLEVSQQLHKSKPLKSADRQKYLAVGQLVREFRGTSRMRRFGFELKKTQLTHRYLMFICPI
jgi:hypothetical protein